MVAFRSRCIGAVSVAVCAVAVHVVAEGGDRGLVNTSRSPHAKVHPVDLDDVRWTGGFWRERFEVCRERMLPRMWEILSDEELCHAWANFEVAAGVGSGRDGDHHGPAWHDGDFYKWLEAVAYVYAVTGDEALDARMDRIIEVIRKAQRDDGYLHTPTLIARRRGHASAREFRDRLDFETYNLGHLMTAACVHHRATGKTSLLDVARKAADYLYDFYKRSTPELARNAICPSHYMGVVEIYRTTRDPRYLELARQLVEMRDLVAGGTDHNQDRVPFREMRQAVGHAVRANYLYAGVADIYMETGDTTLLETLETLWRDVAGRKLYVTGATGALYDGASPDGSSSHRSVQLVHQAYGRPFQLPNITAYNESCATVGNVLWNWRMLLATGEARYADIVELALYNAVLASISLDGTRYFYVNPLRRARELPYELRWSRRRQPYISCFCCPPNVVRTIAEVSSYVYGLSEGAVWVHLFADSELSTSLPGGESIRIRQETEYPWDGDVRLTVVEAPKRPLALKLRIPAWADTATVRRSGELVDSPVHAGSYFEIERAWSAGDVVELRLPMRVRKLEANPLVEEAANQVAVQRGPIVYCLESGDLPGGVRMENVVLPLESVLAPERRRIAGADLVTLKGEGLDTGGAPWKDGELYREASANKPKTFPVTLIPYYAWGNRGDSEMTVWLRAR